MQNLESFKNAENYFKIWAPERQKILKELRRIKDEIQRQARIHTIGSITYSSVGLVGGGLAIAGIVTAPFTFGASLALTVAGVASGVTSGIAGVTHGVVKLGIVKKHVNIAQESLKKHEEACKKMKDLVSLLKEDIDTITADIADGYGLDSSHIKEGTKQSVRLVSVGNGIANLVQSSQALAVYRITGNVDEVAKVMRLATALDDIVPSALKDVSKGVSKLSTEALSVLAAVGIIIDLGSLISNAVDLADIEKGKLCSEAEKFMEVIEQMEREYTVLKDCINQIMNNG
uniref:Uncharacterized protein LOC111132404 n=1 Tax=Crassostrea virginica TaxID=6565 RepID=A0A8B8E8B2_CRAVI|nr:uncharacterized protein LOC111132404 [Crassostrea virginica]